MIHIEWAGKSYDYEESMISLRQAKEIKRISGKSLIPWWQGVMECDPECVEAFHWILCELNGEKAAPNVNFSLSEFFTAVVNAMKRAIEAQQAETVADPKDESETPGS